MLCCQYLWIFRLLTSGSVGGRHEQVRFLRCSAWICWENPLAIYSGSIGSVLVEICHLLSAFWFHAGIMSSSGFAGEKTPIRLGPPDFVKFSTMLFRPEKLIYDQIGHGGSIGVNGRSWIDRLHGEIRVHMVFFTCFWVILEPSSRPVCMWLVQCGVQIASRFIKAHQGQLLAPPTSGFEHICMCSMTVHMHICVSFYDHVRRIFGMFLSYYWVKLCCYWCLGVLSAMLRVPKPCCDNSLVVDNAVSGGVFWANLRLLFVAVSHPLAIVFRLTW